MTVFAKISPKPSITPFTNGKNMLMDNEENKAQTRVRAGSVWSNIARVTDAVVAGRAEAPSAVVVVVSRGAAAGECCREGSGNDMDGKDDVGESTLSQGGESDGSPGGAGRVGGAFELVDRGKLCYVREKGSSIHVISTKAAEEGKNRLGKGKKKGTLPVWGHHPPAKAHSRRHSRRGRAHLHRSAESSLPTRPPIHWC
jgi:hypothetical protein